MTKPSSKAARRRVALAAWWERGPWPCVVAVVDPGRTSGFALVVSRPGHGFDLVLCEGLDLDSTRLEELAWLAARRARDEELPLVVVLETWGKGGPRGLAQWVGLGEARGPWRRVFRQVADRFRPKVLTKKAASVLVTQSRWRSRVVPETGGTDAEGKWEPFDADGWKAAALRAARTLYLSAYVPPLDGAEAACIAAYAVRSDEVAKVLGVRHLRRHGLEFELLEPVIAGKRVAA